MSEELKYDDTLPEALWKPKTLGNPFGIGDEVTVDYRTLLKKYMNRVMESEGTSFAPDRPDEDFSAEDVAVLENILVELADDADR